MLPGANDQASPTCWATVSVSLELSLALMWDSRPKHQLRLIASCNGQIPPSILRLILLGSTPANVGNDCMHCWDRTAPSMEWPSTAH